jgi:SnoaL-like domain
MPLDLPEALPRYFAAQSALDADVMTACFSPDAIVHDEGGTYIGSEAIRGWKRDTIAKYGISIEPLKAAKQDDKTVVIARVAGNFPGSPANLTYAFGLSSDGLIRTLDIH